MNRELHFDIGWKDGTGLRTAVCSPTKADKRRPDPAASEKNVMFNLVIVLLLNAFLRHLSVYLILIRDTAKLKTKWLTVAHCQLYRDSVEVLITIVTFYMLIVGVTCLFNIIIQVVGAVSHAAATKQCRQHDTFVQGERPYLSLQLNQRLLLSCQLA